MVEAVVEAAVVEAAVAEEVVAGETGENQRRGYPRLRPMHSQQACL